jgi:hypothetical protein
VAAVDHERPAMAVKFARQLKDTVDAVSRDGRRDLRFALYMIADILLEAFDSDPQSVAFDRRTVSDAVAIARAAAHVVDACGIIESSLFDARAAGGFAELALPVARNSDALGEFFERCVRSAGERAPVVYMIWEAAPQRYLYVGRTERAGEPPAQRPDARGALFSALQQGSVITVMTPSPAAAIAASDVETALLGVLDRCNALPALNGRPDRVVGALGTAYLTAIGGLLCELAAKLQVPVERYREVIG